MTHLCDFCKHLTRTYIADNGAQFAMCRMRGTVRKIKKWDECMDYERMDDGEREPVRQGRAR